MPMFQQPIFRYFFIVIASFILFFKLDAVAFASLKAFVHPDFLYLRQMRVRTSLPKMVNLNQADVAELLTLPGVNEDMALKMMRFRKTQQMKTVQDLYKMRFVEKRELERLIERIEPRVSF